MYVFWVINARVVSVSLYVVRYVIAWAWCVVVPLLLCVVLCVCVVVCDVRVIFLIM